MAEDALSTLRRLARPPEAEERCELCGTAIPEDHRHLFDTGGRTLVCSCQACTLLFSSEAATRYRAVPTRVLFLPGFRMTDIQWDELLVPVNLAFFVHDSESGAVRGLYPSPAGATPSQLALEAWGELAAANPILDTLEPDVEALLVNRVARARDHFLVPIDECYRLVGMVRAGWKGLGGGPEVWASVAEFFAGLHARARVYDDA